LNKRPKKYLFTIGENKCSCAMKSMSNIEQLKGCSAAFQKSMI
jgi:hypothetical protein